MRVAEGMRQEGLDIVGGCGMIHECDMFGSDNYDDMLHYGGYG